MSFCLSELLMRTITRWPIVGCLAHTHEHLTAFYALKANRRYYFSSIGLCGIEFLVCTIAEWLHYMITNRTYIITLTVTFSYKAKLSLFSF